MDIPRIMIAAIKSGSGKTVITCTLLEALKQRGLNPKSFKCGPDYIDPMFHKKIIGVPSYNIDSFFLEDNQLKELFINNSHGSGIAILEGVMGLYDGLGGISEEASSYHVAEKLNTPIILVIDMHGMGKTVIPMLSGILSYDKSELIKGIILNKTTDYFYNTIKPVIEKELNISVLGYYPVQKELQLESRHLGLKMPDEIIDLKEQVRKSAYELEKTVDINNILNISRHAKAINHKIEYEKYDKIPVKIAVAKDEAFCFYYEDNLNLLKEMGAELVYFSPVNDMHLPKNIDGILIGGGYPELYLKQLADNESMRTEINLAISDGIPSVAECGGFMYLHDEIIDEKGHSYPMCGIIDGKCENKGKLVRFGYINIIEQNSKFLSKKCIIKGHEYHYYDSSSNGEDCLAEKPIGKRKWNCIHAEESHWWGFPHLYYQSCPEYAEHFLKMAEKYHNEKRDNNDM